MKSFQFLVILLTLCSSTALQAQQKAKPVVYIENFSYTVSIGSSYVENLRNEIIEGLVATGRFIVKDVNSESSLKGLFDKQTEDASNADESQLVALRNLNANYVIQGHVTVLQSVAKKDSDGETYYDGQIAFSLKLIDVSNGTLIGSRNFNYEGTPLTCLKGYARTVQEALTASIDCSIDKDMKSVVEEYFPLYGTILEISKEQKGEAKEVYIDLGSQDGIDKKQRFRVYLEREVAGRKSKKEVGDLEVDAVEGDDISLCKVKKGGKDIKIAVGEGQTIILESYKKGGMFDGVSL